MNRSQYDKIASVFNTSFKNHDEERDSKNGTGNIIIEENNTKKQLYNYEEQRTNDRKNDEIERLNIKEIDVVEGGYLRYNDDIIVIYSDIENSRYHFSNCTTFETFIDSNVDVLFTNKTDGKFKTSNGEKELHACRYCLSKMGFNNSKEVSENFDIKQFLIDNKDKSKNDLQKDNELVVRQPKEVDTTKESTFDEEKFIKNGLYETINGVHNVMGILENDLNHGKKTASIYEAYSTLAKSKLEALRNLKDYDVQIKREQDIGDHENGIDNQQTESLTITSTGGDLFDRILNNNNNNKNDENDVTRYAKNE